MDDGDDDDCWCVGELSGLIILTLLLILIIVQGGVPSLRQLEVTLKDEEIEAALKDNTELFDPDLLTPLRQLDVSLDEAELEVNLSEAELESALATNTELFNPDYLTPVRRRRSLTAESRATTQCGCGQAPAAGRIVAGKESDMHSRPYQVYLQSCSSAGCAMCGATLLNKRYALTAMHCVDDATNLVVSMIQTSRTIHSYDVLRLLLVNTIYARILRATRCRSVSSLLTPYSRSKSLHCTGYQSREGYQEA